MKKNILVFTTDDDLHFEVIAEALRADGHSVSRLGLESFPQHDLHTWDYCEGQPTFEASKDQLRALHGAFDTVWLRRITTPDTDTLDVHPHDRRYVKQTDARYAAEILHSLQALLSGPHGSTPLWINPVTGAAQGENKVLQLLLAKRVGLEIPPTVVTNDPSRLRQFMQATGGPIICKAFLPKLWEDHGRIRMNYTSVMESLKEIPEASIKVVPAIYQTHIKKAYEVRSVFMGDRALSSKIDSQADAAATVDWRAMSGALAFEPYSLPPEVTEKCRQLMKAIGVRFACFDFIRTPQGSYVFLELNQAGQFLFAEFKCPDVPLTDAFCHFLINGNLNDWDNRSIQHRAASILEDPETRKRLGRFAKDRALASLSAMN